MIKNFKDFLNESIESDFVKIAQMLDSLDKPSQELGKTMLENIINFDFSNFKIEQLIEKNLELIKKHNIKGLGVFFTTKTGVFKNANDYLSDILEYINPSDADKIKPLVGWWDIKHDTLLFVANTLQGLKYAEWQEKYEYDHNVGDEIRVMSFPEKGSFQLEDFDEVSGYNQLNNLIKDREVFIKIYL